MLSKIAVLFTTIICANLLHAVGSFNTSSGFFKKNILKIDVKIKTGRPNTDKKPKMIESDTSTDTASTLDTHKKLDHREFLSSGSSQIESFVHTTDLLDDLNYERQILEVLKNIPEKNPDGTPWKMIIG